MLLSQILCTTWHQKCPAWVPRLFVPSLTILVFSVTLSGFVLSLFLPEIAATFLGSTDQVAIGIASQTGAVNNAAEVILAFLMSVLAVRFRHKSVLLLGAVFVIISAVGCFLAPDFIAFQVFFAMEGAGSAVVAILAFTLVGDTLPFNKKAKAISLLSAGAYMAGLIGTPMMLLIANAVGWRSVFLLYTLPISVAGLVLGYFTIPSKSQKQQPKIDKTTYTASFKRILSNKSAVSSLIGGIVGSAAIVDLFVLTFYRQQFLLSLDLAVVIGLLNMALFVAGSLVSGRLVSRFGSMSVAVICSLISGIFIIVFFIVPILWLALAFNFVHVIFKAFSLPAFYCIVVDQVQEFRGTMMSFQRISENAGRAIGAAIGGALLALFSYQALGLGFGAMTIVAAAIFFFLVKQPKGT
jgi:DHA1 family purine base/nucleoside efflux pump-like MFS transporter